MTDIGALVRIFEPTTTDDFVDKRKLAISNIRDKLKAVTKVPVIFSHANAFADGLATAKLPEPLFGEVGDAIQRVSSAFVRETGSIEMIVCTLGAAHMLAEETKPSAGGWTVSETFSAAVLSALTILKPNEAEKLEIWIQSLIRLTAEVVEQAANSSRRRQLVPEFSIAGIEGEGAPAIANRVKAAFNKVWTPALLNSQMDREELDLLWWSMGDWSDLLGTKISNLPPPVKLVVSSLEVVHRLKRVPATAHSYIAMRHNDNTEKFSLLQIKDALEPYRIQLSQAIDGISATSSYPRIFPFLSSVFLEGASDDITMDAFNWCQRIVLEGGLTTKLTPRVVG